MTSKRSARGEGTIYYDAKAKRFRVAIPVKVQGKTKRIERVAKTKAEALTLKRQLLNDRDHNLLAIGIRQKFRDYAMHYLEFEAPSRCKQTTIDFYYGILDNHIFPVFGDRSFRDISSKEIQEFLNDLHNHQDFASKSVETIRSVMCSIYSSAERRGDIEKNPMRRTEPPRFDPFEKKKRHPIWTDKERKEVITKTSGTEFETYLYLVLSTGIRLGETLGLMWSDFDFDSGTMIIQRTLRATTSFRADGATKSELVFNTPKTPDSFRFLQLQPAVLQSLHLHHMKQQLMKDEAGKSWKENDLVFCKPDGSPINPSTYRGQYQRFLKQIGVRYIAPHDIRHTFAMTLMENNATIEQVQQAMGHSDTKTTKNVYARDVPVLGHQAVALMTSILFPESEIVPIIGAIKPAYQAKARALKGTSGKKRSLESK